MNGGLEKSRISYLVSHANKKTATRAVFENMMMSA